MEVGAAPKRCVPTTRPVRNILETEMFCELELGHVCNEFGQINYYMY